MLLNDSPERILMFHRAPAVWSSSIGLYWQNYGAIFNNAGGYNGGYGAFLQYHQRPVLHLNNIKSNA